MTATECDKCGGTGLIPKEWDEDDFEEFLNDSWGDVAICGMKFPSGRALRELDPVAFRCAMADIEENEDCPDCDGTGEIDDGDEAGEEDNKETGKGETGDGGE